MTLSCSPSTCVETEAALRPPSGFRDFPAPGAAAAMENPEEAWRLETLGAMAEGMVHDFNNILASISGFAELILMREEAGTGATPGSAGSARIARLILEAATAGHGAVESLSRLTRAGREESEELDLHEMINGTVVLSRGAMGIRIGVGCDLALGPARIRGCRGLLQNVLLNLLINARDAMPRGGRIRIATRLMTAGLPRAGAFWRLSVRDNGTGMTREVLGRIWERAFTTKGRKGSGLGLPNVRRTVEMHGGWITVDSTPGFGTEFHLHLPAVP